MFLLNTKGISFLVFLSMVSTPFFQATTELSAENAVSEPGFSYEEIAADLKYVENEIKNNTSSADIGAKAEAALNNFSVNGSEPRELPGNYTITDADFYQPSVPWIMSTIQNTTQIALLEQLSAKPLSYYILTRCKDVVKWTEGSLSSTIPFPASSRTSQKIDIDNNSATGNTNGNEIEVSIFPSIELTGSISIFSSNNITIGGTLNFLVSKLTQENLSLEIYLIKAVTYGQKNYIWYIGFNFSDLSTNFLSTISIKNVAVTNIIGALLENLLSNTPAEFGNITNILNFNGPYKMAWDADTNLSGLDVASGYTFVGGDTSPERVWFSCSISPGSGHDTIPKKATIDIEGTSDITNTYKWSGDSTSRLRFEYGTESVNRTYVSVNISELPKRAALTTYDDGYSGYVNYSGDGVIEKLEIFTHEYNLNTSKHNYVKITNLSTELLITMPTYKSTETVRTEEDNRGFVEKLVDNIMWQITSKFRRIGEIVNAVSSTINKAYPDNVTFECKSRDYIDAIEFISVGNSTAYISSNGTFFGVLHNAHGGEISLSGRVCNIKEMAINSTDGLYLETSIKEKTPLRIIFSGESQTLEANISCINEHTRIEFASDEIKIISKDAYENYANIDKATIIYLSNTTNDYFSLKAYDIPGTITMKFSQEHLELAAEGYIGRIEFAFTNKTIPRINGGHLFSQHTQSESYTSFKLEKLKSFELNRSASTFDVVSLYNKPFWIVVSDNETENSSATLNATVFLSVLPSAVSIGAPFGLINTTPYFNTSSLSINQSTNVSAIFDFMGGISSSVKNMSAFFSDLIDRVAAYGFSSSFKFDKNTTLIAKIEKGDTSIIGPIDWRYGIVAKNKEIHNKTATSMKIYMDGISKNSRISSYLGKNETTLHLNIQDYRGSADNIVLDSSAIGGKNITFYLGNITKGTNITGEMNFTKNEINGIDSINTKINLTASERLGQCYFKMEESDKSSTTSVLIPYTPKQIQMGVSIFGDIKITYNSSEKLDYLYANTSKFESGKQNLVNATLYNVPASFSISLESQKEFDMTDLNLAKLLPMINSENSASGADLYIQTDGACIGQKGSYRVIIENISTCIVGTLNAGAYLLNSNNLNYISIEVENLPVSEYYRLNSLRIVAKNIQTLSIKTSTILGYPLVELGDLTLEYLDITIKHSLMLFGMKIDGVVVLTDINFSDIFSTNTYSNGINLSNQKNSKHFLMPAPIKTIVYTIARNMFGGDCQWAM